MEKDNSIYHYCSVDTFMAIIQNKTIRLSDLNKTNDYMEKKWANKLIIDVLKKKLCEYEISMDLEEDYWYDEQSHSHLAHYTNELKRVLYDESPILITCFSQEKDRLSQWRAYGQDGMGVAVGFDYKLISKLKDERNVRVEKVFYKRVQQENRLGELIESVILYIHNMFETDLLRSTDDFSSYFKEEFDVFCEVLVDYIGQVGCTIKNPAFAEEKETRIIYNPALSNREIMGDMEYKEAQKYFTSMKEISNYRIKPLRFNYRNNQLVAFCDLDFSHLINKGIINEIVIGPKSKIKEDDMYYLLMSSGIDANNIKISKSEATYR